MFIIDAPGKGESVGHCLTLMAKDMSQGKGLVLGFEAERQKEVR